MDLLSQLADQLAAAVESRLGLAAWVDQRTSPLGRNRHCAAARRRLDAAKPGEDPGVRRIGRRYLMSPEALRQESLRLLEHPGLARTTGPDALDAAMARAKMARRGA